MAGRASDAEVAAVVAAVAAVAAGSARGRRRPARHVPAWRRAALAEPAGAGAAASPRDLDSALRLR